MNNRRINDLGGGKARTERVNEPALETQNARLEQVGPFRVDALAASQAGVAEKLAATDANAPTGWRAGRGGHVIGIVWDLSTAVTAGTATVQATLNGTGTGDTANLASATSGVQYLSTPMAFAAGDAVGVKHTTNGAFTPTPNVRVWLLVRWTAIETVTPEGI